MERQTITPTISNPPIQKQVMDSKEEIYNLSHEITDETIKECADKGTLLKMKDAVHESLLSVKAQIDRAKAKMERMEEVDLDWFAKAKAFKRRMGWLDQKIMLKEQELRKIDKRQLKTVNDFFVDVCRELFDKDQFISILNEASSRRNANQ